MQLSASPRIRLQVLHLAPPSLRDLDDLLSSEVRNRACFESHINARAADYYSREGVATAIEAAVLDASTICFILRSMQTPDPSRPSLQLMPVSLESPNQPEVIALIADLDAYQDTLYPAEARYALDLASLAKPNVLFAVARDAAGLAVGCGAIVLHSGYGEVKRMYVRPESRGQRTARQIINTLESAAYARGCTTLMLETGPYQEEALAFYSKQGYLRCGPFGDYPDHPLSVFMCRQLASEPSSTPRESEPR